MKCTRASKELWMYSLAPIGVAKAKTKENKMGTILIIAVIIGIGCVGFFWGRLTTALRYRKVISAYQDAIMDVFKKLLHTILIRNMKMDNPTIQLIQAQMNRETAECTVLPCTASACENLAYDGFAKFFRKQAERGIIPCSEVL